MVYAGSADKPPHHFQAGLLSPSAHSSPPSNGLSVHLTCEHAHLPTSERISVFIMSFLLL